MHGNHNELTNVSLRCQLNRLKVVERERDDLESAKTEAEEFLGMQSEVARKQAVLYQKYM